MVVVRKPILLELAAQSVLRVPSHLTRDRASAAPLRNFLPISVLVRVIPVVLGPKSTALNLVVSFARLDSSPVTMGRVSNVPQVQSLHDREQRNVKLVLVVMKPTILDQVAVCVHLDNSLETANVNDVR